MYYADMRSSNERQENDKILKIRVRVVPRAKKECISEEGGNFKVYVRAPAIDNKANKALIEVLARYFNIKKRNIRIVRGEKSREKIVEIGKVPLHKKGGRKTCE